MTHSPAQGQPASRARMLVPGVARGWALLGIAMANIPTGWAGSRNLEGDPSLGGFRPDAGATWHVLDQAAMIFGAMFVHVRGLPLFATLLGFGVGLITLSLQRRGIPHAGARKTLLRRYGFLALIGLVHCIFIFYGDIMLLYGLLAMLLALCLRLSHRTLVWIAGILYLLGVAGGIVFATFVSGTDYSLLYIPAQYSTYLLMGAAMAVGYVVSVVPALFSIFPVMIVGFVFARAGIIHEPEEHRRILRWWVVAGVAVIVLVGLPWGIAAATGHEETALTLNMLNGVFGYITGPAALSFATLLLMPAQAAYRATGVIPVLHRAPAALGARSMSGYVGQSVILFVLMLPFTLHLFTEAGAFGYMLVAVGVWVATLVFAYLLSLRNLPGPLEAVHRRLAYGKQGLPVPTAKQ